MKDNHIIRVKDLSKRYRIGLEEERHEHLLSAFAHLVKSPFRNFKKYRSLYKFDNDPNAISHQDDTAQGIIWALRGVSFDVKQGEVLGIIGKNGAGKSTLLKILSRITHPTGGRIEAYGRVSCLLEVGTGFHPELTGRENVYLNGTILGMRKKEIDRKFKEIVEFSEVGKFIDTPVKRYSSGMKVRLAFSVAAHIEPEILIIDEVLAVGDASFRKKCYSKMEEIGEKGRTVLFVSHDLQAIQRLCPRTILIDSGKLKADGPSSEVVSEYLNSELGVSSCREWNKPSESPGGEVARLRAVRVKSKNGENIDTEKITNPVLIEMEFEVLKSGFVLLPNFHFYNSTGIEIISAVDLDPKWRKQPRPEGIYVTTAEIPGNLLTEGLYFVRTALITLDPLIPQFNVHYAVAFTIVDDFDGNSSRGDYFGKLPGIIRPYLAWATKYIKN